MNMKRFSRNLLHKCLSKLLGVRNRVLNHIDRPIVVLIYHRVTSLSTDPQLLAVTPENFRAHIAYLKKNFPIIRFEDNWSQVKQPAVVITFDDGYADNLYQVLPILEEFDVPATFFISTAYLGDHTEFWWDELERLILLERVYPVAFCMYGEDSEKVWPTGTKSERVNMYQEIHTIMKQANTRQRSEWLRQLRLWAGVNEVGRDTHRIMTTSELQLLATNKNVTIGAHTVTHTRLSAISVDEQKHEILESRRRLEELIKKEISVFSYPFGGRKDYSRESVILCRDANFIRSASNFRGQSHRWTDRHQIPRQLVRNWSIEEFTKKMQTFWTL